MLGITIHPLTFCWLPIPKCNSDYEIQSPYDSQLASHAHVSMVYILQKMALWIARLFWHFLMIFACTIEFIRYL